MTGQKTRVDIARQHVHALLLLCRRRRKAHSSSPAERQLLTSVLLLLAAACVLAVYLCCDSYAPDALEESQHDSSAQHLQSVSSRVAFPFNRTSLPLRVCPVKSASVLDAAHGQDSVLRYHGGTLLIEDLSLYFIWCALAD